MASAPDIDSVLGVLLSITSIDDLRGNPVCKQLEALTDDQLADAISQQDAQDTHPLHVLNPATQSLGYLYFITTACCRATETQAQELYTTLVSFVNMADIEQIKLAGKQMNRICLAFEHLATVQENSMLILAPLRQLIHRLVGDTTRPCVLTPFHSVLAKHCLISKMYKFPLPILDHYVMQVDPKTFGTTIQEYLEYHYYGALLYIGNKQFAKAFDFLSLVIAAPQHKAVSLIQIEALKRYVLVSLILFGKFQPLPKHVPYAIEKICRKRHANYFQLAQVFHENDVQGLNSLLESRTTSFASDNLYGLVKQLQPAMYRKRILSLTDVYCKIHLDDMARIIPEPCAPLDVAVVESLLLDMVQKKEIDARISTVTVDGRAVKLVTFLDEEKSGVAKDPSAIQHNLLRAMGVNDKLAAMDKAEGLNKDFQAKYMMLNATKHRMGNASMMDDEMEATMDEDVKIY